MFFIEVPYIEVMTKERYMGVWKPVNDIRVQAGEEKFQEILLKIGDFIHDLTEFEVPYRARAWTVRAVK